MWPTLFSIVLHILNFIILFIIVDKLIYKPVVKMLNARTAAIDEKRTEAENNNQEALALQASYKEQLGTIDAQREKVRLEAVEEASSMSDAIVAEAKQKADTLVEDAKRNADERRANVAKENEKEIRDLAFELAEDIVQRELSQGDNQKIINDFFDQGFKDKE